MKQAVHIQRNGNLIKVAGFIVAGLLGACAGGGGGNNHEVVIDKKDPVVTPAQFNRLGIDVHMYPNAPYVYQHGLLGAKIDANGNVTLQSKDINGNKKSPFNDVFQISSAMLSGDVNGGVIHSLTSASKFHVGVITSKLTKHVKNIYWEKENEYSSFGFGLAGYVNKLPASKWPSKGVATYKGLGLQFVLYTGYGDPASYVQVQVISYVTAKVDFASKTISVTIVPELERFSLSTTSFGNPDFINRYANNIDPSRFTANYTITNLDLSGTHGVQHTSKKQASSGLGWEMAANGLAFFGDNMEELGGYA